MLATVITGQVAAIGLHESSLGNLKIGSLAEPALQIDSVSARYSLTSVIKGKIDLIEINGLVINLEISEDGVRLPGFDPERISGSEPSKEAQALSLPLQFDNFTINKGLLKISYEGQRALLPFALQVTAGKNTVGSSQPFYLLEMQVSPEGENVLTTGSFDIAGNQGTLTLTADSLDLQKFVFLLGEQGENLRFGRTTVKADAAFSLMPFQIENAAMQIDLTSLALGTVPVSFDSVSTDIGKPAALQLMLTADGQQYHVAGRGVLAEPIAADITIEGTTALQDSAMTGTGTLTWSFTEDTLSFKMADRPVTVTPPPIFKENFSFEKNSSGAWQASIESQPDKQVFQVIQDNNSLTAKNPVGNIVVKGTPDIMEMQFAMKLADLRVEHADNPEITMPALGLQGSLKKTIIPDKGEIVSGNFAVESPDMKIQHDSLSGSADIELVGRLVPQEFQAVRDLKADGGFIVKKASITDRTNGVVIDKISGRLPWQFAVPNHEYSGELHMSGIRWGKNELGVLQMEILLKDQDYTWSGSFLHALPNGLVTEIKGQARPFDSGGQADIHISMEPTEFSAVQLGRFSPDLEKSTISAVLGLKGDFLFDAQGLQGSFGLEFNNGQLEFTEKKYRIDNISGSLELPSLPALRSAPGQIVAFDKASIGDLVFENGRVTWQLESPSSLLIEKGEVNWAGGRVSTNEVRITPAKKEIEATIFCDELLLTEILTQAGVKNAAGEGTVSGRLPLRIGRNAIDVSDGLLYSSPEHGGFIRLSALDVLSAGIPKNTPQFAQIDFAAEALKNFKYNWVRLLLNSEGEDLVMQMQMDGRPVQSLPFRYDSQTGLLQRSAAGEKGIDQPIRLDVNFRLPLNRLLGYSGKIQDIWDKIK